MRLKVRLAKLEAKHFAVGENDTVTIRWQDGTEWEVPHPRIIAQNASLKSISEKD